MPPAIHSTMTASAVPRCVAGPAARAELAEAAADPASVARAQRRLAAGQRRQRAGGRRADELPPAQAAKMCRSSRVSVVVSAGRWSTACGCGRPCRRAVASAVSCRRPWRASVDQLELGLHQDRPQEVGDAGRREPAGSASASATALFGECALGRGRRASEGLPEDAVDQRRVRCRRECGRRQRHAGRPAAAAARRSGAASKTKKRTAGLSVEPISLRGVGHVDAAAEPHEAAAR